MTYAQGRAAVAPGGSGAPADPATLDYAGGRAAVAPAAADPAAAERARAAAARASYQALLGTALGGKLYELVSKELAADKIMALGSKGLDAAAQAGVGAIHTVDGAQIIDEASEAEAVKQFAGALADWAKGEADGWLAGDDGKAFAVKVSQWFEGNPAAVVGLALLAAAGAVASNASIPELQQKFQLTDTTSVNAGLDLNKLRDIAVKSAHLGVDWKKGDVAAALTYSFQKGENGAADTHAVSGKVGDSHKSLTADATVQGDKLVLKTAGEYKGDGLTVAAGVQQTRQSGSNTTTLADAKVTIGSDTKNVTADAKYDTSTGDLSIGVDALQKFDGGVSVMRGLHHEQKGGASSTVQTMGVSVVGDKQTFDANVSDGSDGHQSAEVKGTQKFTAGRATGEAHGSAAYDSTAGASAGAGMALQTPDDLKVTLDAMLREHGSSTLTGSVEKKSGEFSAKGSATVDLTDAKLQQLAVQFGFQSKDSFNAFLVDYKRNYGGDAPTQELDVLVQAQLGQLMLRGTSKTTFERDALRGNVTGIQGAYPIGHDLSLIGGARYGFDDPQRAGLTDRERGAWLEAGVQFKGVPIVVGYRPEDKAVTVGITIPFGK